MISLNYEDIENHLINNDFLNNNIFGAAGTSLKRYNIINIASLVLNHHHNRNILEIGVAHGDTAKLLVNNFNNKNTNFYFFDTYEGLPLPSKSDECDINVRGNYKFSIEDVIDVVNIKGDNINFIKGLVENTLVDNLPDKIDFVHLDCDLYSPTYFSLSKIIPKMSKPSAIIIDDYKCSYWTGVKKACDEIEKEFGVKFNLLCDKSNLTQAILILF